MSGTNSILPDWRDLVRLSDTELAKYDIAVLNLACAVGLPGSERIDASGCLKYIDRWADAIRQRIGEQIETEFRCESATYAHNEPLFRMVKLVHFLQRQAKVLYNPARTTPTPGDPVKAQDDFIFGAIQGPGGTCASLPVVYTAVARRVGYPVYLVWTKGHAFCRWDDPSTGIKVNIEGTSHDGVNTYTDDHYRQWPHPFGAREEEDMGHFGHSARERNWLHSLMDGVWYGRKRVIVYKRLTLLWVQLRQTDTLFRATERDSCGRFGTGPSDSRKKGGSVTDFDTQ